MKKKLCYYRRSCHCQSCSCVAIANCSSVDSRMPDGYKCGGKILYCFVYPSSCSSNM